MHASKHLRSITDQRVESAHNEYGCLRSGEGLDATDIAVGKLANDPPQFLLTRAGGVGGAQQVDPCFGVSGLRRILASGTSPVAAGVGGGIDEKVQTLDAKGPAGARLLGRRERHEPVPDLEADDRVGRGTVHLRPYAVGAGAGKDHQNREGDHCPQRISRCRERRPTDGELRLDFVQRGLLVLVLDSYLDRDRPVGVHPVDQERCRDGELGRGRGDVGCRRRRDHPRDVRPAPTKDIELSLLRGLGRVAEDHVLDPGFPMYGGPRRAMPDACHTAIIHAP